jgi:hypothetical protein
MFILREKAHTVPIIFWQMFRRLQLIDSQRVRGTRAARPPFDAASPRSFALAGAVPPWQRQQR